MNTISSLSPGRQMMDARISQAVSSGTISSADQTAFESALDNIDSSLASSTTTSSGASGTDIKSKMDSLIQDQVSDGTLTSDQASELQSLFAQQGPGGPPPQGGDASDGGSDQIASVDGTQAANSAQGFDQMGSMGGPQGMQGPPPPPPPGDSDASDSASSDTSATSSSTSSASDGSGSAAAGNGIDVKQLDAFISFLENLRSSMSTTYGDSTATSASTSGVLVDTSA